MGQVHITILGRSYALDCDMGQEHHLTQLATQLNGRLQDLAQRMPGTSDHDLLAMLSLTLLDEMSESLPPKTTSDAYQPQLLSLLDRLERLNRLVVAG